MLPRFLWGRRWARKAHGGKWERWGLSWIPVDDWSTPKDHPDEYGRGEIPEREDWTSRRT